MNKYMDGDTRTHLLETGERLCLQRGFTGMGLAELLKVAGVPKGSFYHYFRSKEAFGVAMLQRYYQRSMRENQRFFEGPGSAGERIVAWYQRTQHLFCSGGMAGHCLAVKLSAEVCDLSDEMQSTLNQGSAQLIALLADTLRLGQRDGSVHADHPPEALAITVYTLWLGAHLQAKVSRSVRPLECALNHIHLLLTRAPL